MADDVAAELERLYRATEARIGREPREDELVFVDPLTGEPLNKKMVLLRYRRRYVRRDSTRPIASTISDTPSEPRWPRPALRSARCRMDGTPRHPDDDALRRLHASTHEAELIAPRSIRPLSGCVWQTEDIVGPQT